MVKMPAPQRGDAFETASNATNRCPRADRGPLPHSIEETSHQEITSGRIALIPQGNSLISQCLKIQIVSEARDHAAIPHQFVAGVSRTALDSGQQLHAAGETKGLVRRSVSAIYRN